MGRQQRAVLGDDEPEDIKNPWRGHHNADGSEKVGFESKRAARSWVRNSGGWDPVPNIYRCTWGSCRAWHLGRDYTE